MEGKKRDGGGGGGVGGVVGAVLAIFYVVIVDIMQRNYRPVRESGKDLATKKLN